MLKWIEFLHIYQPPNQESGVLDQVVIESYNHIVWLLTKYPNFKITLNISGSLLEQLDGNGYTELIKNLKFLIKQGKIELVSSAMYHPILPLLPESEVIRQIKLNNEIITKRLGLKHQPAGFYLPEMAYSPRVAAIVKALGYQWIILDEIHFPKKHYNNQIKYQIKNNGLYVIFRNRAYSKSFPPESIVKNIKKLNPPIQKNNYLITAHDGELYGHFHKNDYGYYQKAFAHQAIKNILISDYLKTLKTTEQITPRSASWESTELELKKHIPFALWADPKNKIHQKFWALSELAIKTVNQNQSDPNYFWSRKHLDYGLSSCYFWWAAAKRPDSFSPVTWNPTAIEKGLKELTSSIRSLEHLNPRVKLKAEKLYLALIKIIWQKHWKKYYQKNEKI